MFSIYGYINILLYKYLIYWYLFYLIKFIGNVVCFLLIGGIIEGVIFGWFLVIFNVCEFFDRFINRVSKWFVVFFLFLLGIFRGWFVSCLMFWVFFRCEFGVKLIFFCGDVFFVFVGNIFVWNKLGFVMFWLMIVDFEYWDWLW